VKVKSESISQEFTFSPASKLMKIVWTIIILLVAFFVFIRVIENKLIFFPFKYPQGYWQPETFGLKVEDVIFEAPGGVKLHGWFVKNDSAKTTLLWCHGNAGNVTDRLDNLTKFQRLPANVFIFDYRGYGKSEGSPSEAGVYFDAEAAYDFLLSAKGIKPKELIIFGRSLGGAIAIDLATKKPCRKLVLESTFTSAADMAKEMFGAIPVQWVVKSGFDSISKIKKLELPVLFFHGNRDGVVPFELGRQLFEAANEPKDFYEIEGAGHNDTYIVGGDAYFEKFREFLVSVD